MEKHDPFNLLAADRNLVTVELELGRLRSDFEDDAVELVECRLIDRSRLLTGLLDRARGHLADYEQVGLRLSLKDRFPLLGQRPFLLPEADMADRARGD